MPSQQDVATFTLSFSGVDFTLEPDCSSDIADVLSIAKVCNNEVVVDFSNFTGVLRVHKGANMRASSEAMHMASALQTKETEQSMDVDKIDAPTIPDEVPEEVPSPEPKEDKETKKKGQQTLNFFNTKKETKASIKRSSEEKPERSSRKKTRSNIKDEVRKHCDDESSGTQKDESQNTKFTMASLGQDMPSQESGEQAEDIVKAMSNSEEVAANVDVLDHDNFSFNMDDFSGDDFSFKNKLTPLKEDAIATFGSITPCPRWGQSMTMIDHRRLVVYGGQTIDSATQTAMPLADLFVYDLMDHTWTKPINCEGVARTWHSANFLPDKQLLLCFGGDVVDDKGKTTTTDQVMVLDTEIMLWYPPSVSGQVPSGRSGHTASLLPNTNELVVFGGVKNGKWLNSVSVLDTGRWKWSSPKILGDAPRPRSYHSSTSIESSDDEGSRIVIFGGNNDSKCFNCVHILEQIKGKMTWSHPKVSGKPPSPRTGHSATLLEDGHTIMIYGGWDPNTEDEKGDDLIFGDSYLLDTNDWTWSKGPKPKYAPFNAAETSNGGVERVGHSSVLAPGGDGVQVLAFGGRLPDGFAADFQSLLPPAPQMQRDPSVRRKSIEKE